MTQARYIGMTRLIWVGTRFRNLWEKLLGDLGDQEPSDALGDDEEDEAGEYMAKLLLNDDASRLGNLSVENVPFSSSIETDDVL